MNDYYIDCDNTLRECSGNECKVLKKEGYSEYRLPYDFLSIEQIQQLDYLKENYNTECYTMCESTFTDEYKVAVYCMAYFLGIEMNEDIFRKKYNKNNLLNCMLFAGSNKIEIVNDISEMNRIMNCYNELIDASSKPNIMETRKSFADYNRKFYIKAIKGYTEEIIKKMVELGGSMKYPFKDDYGSDIYFTLDEELNIIATAYVDKKEYFEIELSDGKES